MEKRIVAVFVIIVLVCVAFGFPLAINYYNDKSSMNKIQYVESKDIDVIAVNNNKNNQNIASRLQILEELLSSDAMPVSLELNFDPSEDKLKEIHAKIDNEMTRWFGKDIFGLQELGIDIGVLSDFTIQDIRLYSVGKVSFFQIDAMLEGNSDTFISITMDSDYYKIYYVYIYGEVVKKIRHAYDDDVVVAYEDVAKNLAEEIGQYYGIAEPEISEGSVSDGGLNSITLNSITYILLSNLEWKIEFYGKETMPVMTIGIEI